MNQLTEEQVEFVLSRLPSPALAVLKEHCAVLAGGFIRSVLVGEKPKDVDLFFTNSASAHLAADALARSAGFASRYDTANAVTIQIKGFVPIQCIHRWHGDTPAAIIGQFDFTVSQAAIWYTHGTVDGDAGWRAVCAPSYLADLADKRLVYTCPVREEAKAGSLIRVFKFFKRGYKIAPEETAKVLARCVSGIPALVEARSIGEEALAGQIVQLLAEAGHRIPAPPKPEGPTCGGFDGGAGALSLATSAKLGAES